MDFSTIKFKSKNSKFLFLSFIKRDIVIYLQRVATEIKDIGLYDLVLQDVQKIVGKTKLTIEEILEVLDTHPQVLEDYKQINVEYNIGNIHLKNIDIDQIDPNYKKDIEKINSNLDRLRDLEKYTLDFEQSSTLVIIFSIEFFVLFSVQYFIVLLDLKEWQTLIYSIFASSVAVAYWYGKKEQKKYKNGSEEFYKLYDETLLLIDTLEKKGIIKKENLIIKECEEHV